MNVVTDLMRNIDKKIVVSGVVTAFVVGGMIWGLNKAGLKQVAAIAKGGK